MINIKIIKSKSYTKDYRTKLKNKHLTKELERLSKIEQLLISSANMKEVMEDGLHIIYGIEKKSGNLKQYYTARLNQKLRLVIKPVNCYPYNLEEVYELEFISIDDKHYGDG